MTQEEGGSLIGKEGLTKNIKSEGHAIKANRKILNLIKF